MAQINNRQLNVSIPVENIVPKESSAFESSIGSWTTYADAAQAQPVDGTGGSPSVTLARTTTSAEVLNGTASLKFSKDAVDRQGQGASLDMTVPNYLKGQPCKVSMSAKASANFDFGTPFSSNDPSDITVYLYDVTNSKLLQPYPYTIMSNMGYEGTFQIPSDCSSLRLILHVTTTNATAYDLFIDDVSIELAENVTVSLDSDWQAYTPTFSNLGTVTSINVRYRKKGSNIQIAGMYTIGTGAAAVASISLPAGLTTTSDLGTATLVGYLGFQSASDPSGQILASANSTVLNLGLQSSVLTGLVAANGNTFASSTRHSFFCEVPIQGWTSSQVTAASANLNAPVVFLAAQAVGQAVTANVTDITYGTVYKDTTNSWSTNIYTVKVPGDYLASLTLSNTSGAFSPRFYKNGVAYTVASSASAANFLSNGITLLPDLKVGDTISVRSDLTSTVQNGSLAISRISVPSAIYATRVAYLKDIKSSGTNGGTFTSGSYQTRTLNTIEGDQSFVTLSSNQFTLQPGTYKIAFSAPAYSGTASSTVINHKAKLRNITDSSDVIIGTAEAAYRLADATTVQTRSVGEGMFSITAAKTFEIQHRCLATSNTSGLGIAAAFGDSEVYTVVKLEKVL